MNPFRLKSKPVARVWGGHRIAELFDRPPLPGGQPVGEYWDVHGSLTGPDGGATLDEMLAQQGERLVGSWGAAGLTAERPTFPLLLKWLDCQDWLSVQVHPDDPTARELTADDSSLGKNECWYFLEVGPQAELLHGWREAPPPDLARLSGQDWLETARRYQPKVGEWLHVPAGTVHALGPGLVLFEVQQSSDLTYRLYDFERLGLDGVPRELHLEQGRLCARGFELPPDPTVDQLAELLGEVRVLCPYFVVEEVRGARTWRVQGTSCEIVTLLHGAARLGELSLAPGDSAVLPASCGEVELEADPAAGWARIRLVPPPQKR